MLQINEYDDDDDCILVWAHQCHPPQRHLDRLSRFYRAHRGDQQTDRQTHRQTIRYSVCSNKLHLAIAAMRPNDTCIYIFIFIFTEKAAITIKNNKYL